MRVVDQLLVYTKVVEVIQLQYPKNNYELYDAKVETEVQQGLRDTRPRGADLADTWFLIGFQKYSRATDFKHIFADFT